MIVVANSKKMSEVSDSLPIFITLLFASLFLFWIAQRGGYSFGSLSIIRVNQCCTNNRISQLKYRKILAEFQIILTPDVANVAIISCKM